MRERDTVDFELSGVEIVMLSLSLGSLLVIFLIASSLHA